MRSFFQECNKIFFDAIPCSWFNIYTDADEQAIKDFLLKSLFVPVVVSVISSLIVASVGYLWSMRSIKENSQSPIAQPASELITDTNGLNHQ